MSWLAWVVASQNELQRALAGHVRAVAAGEQSMLAMLAVGLLLGSVHALTPGHGKAVVFSYFLGRAARPSAGLAMAGKIALAHGVTAVVLVAIFGTAVSTFGRPSGAAWAVQTISYAAIALFGAYYLFESVRHRTQRPAEAGSGHAHAGLLPYAVGLLPCPLTMLVVTFAWAQAQLVLGVVLAAVIAAGAAVTIALVGGLGMLVRGGAILGFDAQGLRYGRLLGGLEIASSAAILVLGLVFLAGSLA